MHNNSPSFFSVSQICDIVGISKSSVRRYIKSGKLPHIKLGRRILIPKEVIEALSKKALLEARNG